MAHNYCSQDEYDVQSSFADSHITIRSDGNVEWHSNQHESSAATPLYDFTHETDHSTVHNHDQKEALEWEHIKGFGDYDHSDPSFEPAGGLDEYLYPIIPDPSTRSSPFDILRNHGMTSTSPAIPSIIRPPMNPGSLSNSHSAHLLTPSTPPASSYINPPQHRMEVATRPATRIDFLGRRVDARGTVKPQVMRRAPSLMESSPQGDENSSSSDEEHMEENAESPSNTSLNLPPPREYKYLSPEERAKPENKMKRAKNYVAVRKNRMAAKERGPAILRRLQYLEKVVELKKIRLPNPTIFNLAREIREFKFEPTHCERKKIFPESK